MEKIFKILSCIATGYGLYNLFTDVMGGIYMYLMLPTIFRVRKESFGEGNPLLDQEYISFLFTGYIVIGIAMFFATAAGVIGIVWSFKHRRQMLVASIACMAIGTLIRGIFNLGIAVPQLALRYAPGFNMMEQALPEEFIRIFHTVSNYSMMRTVIAEVLWICFSAWMITLAIKLRKKDANEKV